MGKKEMTLRDDNPVPFKQPFLYVRFKDSKFNGCSSGWCIDVNGNIGKYIKGKRVITTTMTNYMDRATDLLKEILDEFKAADREVIHVGTYRGSAGPTHILRNGAIFRRIHLDDPSYIFSITE